MGQIIDHRYKIIKKIGEGGMGAVYLAEDMRLERKVAIKRLQLMGKRADLDMFQKRFERESKEMARFQHTNIVSVYDYGQDDEGIYLVQEYMPGGTLSDRMKNGPIPVDDAIEIIVPIARALQVIHDLDRVHRDVKPANILFDAYGVPKLADFGIVKLVEGDEGHTLTATGAVIGTPAYMAPELIRGDASPLTDQYALGVVFYEMVTGKKPFKGRTPMETMLMQQTKLLPNPLEFNAQLEVWICDVLKKVLDKSPKYRYKNLNSFIKVFSKQHEIGNSAAFKKNARENEKLKELNTIIVEKIEQKKLPEPKVNNSIRSIDKLPVNVEDILLKEEIRTTKKNPRKNVWLGGIGFLGIVGIILFGNWILNSKKINSQTADNESSITIANTIEDTALVVPSETIESASEPQKTDVLVPTSTETHFDGYTLYFVREGETLQNIAESAEITVENLRATNYMLGDFLLIDQKLYIPPNGEESDSIIIYSSLTSDELYSYMLKKENSEDTFLYIFMEENRLAFQAREQLSNLVEDAFSFVEDTLAGEAPASVTIYIGSGLFQSETELRSVYNPKTNRLYVLHNGSGNLAVTNFHLVYGMGSLWGEEVWGGSPDDFLREGLPLSLADTRNLESGNLTLCDIAKTYQEVGQLPSFNDSLELTSWVIDMVDLSTVGCYFNYLRSVYESEAIQSLYQTGDYSKLNGGSFVAEESLFHAWLKTYGTSQVIDSPKFVEQMNRLVWMNNEFFSKIDQWEYSTEILYSLDQAYLGLWRNDVHYAMVRMTTAEAMLGLNTDMVTTIPTVYLTPTPTEDTWPTWTPAP